MATSLQWTWRAVVIIGLELGNLVFEIFVLAFESLDTILQGNEIAV